MSDPTEGVDLFAQVTGDIPAAVEEPVSTETTPAPDGEASLPDQQATSETVAEVTTGVASPALVVEQEPQARPEGTRPAPNPWETPEGKAILAKSQAMDQLQQQANQIRIQKQSEQVSNELNELADGDPERLQKLHSLLARVATPLGQQSQQFAQRANASEKTLAALWIAAKAHLPEEQLNALVAETEDLMQIEGAELMQQKVSGKLETQRTHQAALSAKDQEIAELQRQLSARMELAARGNVDAVDGGTGSVPLTGNIDDQMRAAPDMDSFFDSWSKRGRAA